MKRHLLFAFIFISILISLSCTKKDTTKIETKTYQQLREDLTPDFCEKGEKVKVKRSGLLLSNNVMFDLVCVCTRESIGIKELPYDAKLLEEIRQEMQSESHGKE